MKTVDKLEIIGNGGTAYLCEKDIVSMIVNMQEAKEKLDNYTYSLIKSIYNYYYDRDEMVLYDKKELKNKIDDLCEKFNSIAPIELYDGSNYCSKNSAEDGFEEDDSEIEATDGEDIDECQENDKEGYDLITLIVISILMSCFATGAIIIIISGFVADSASKYGSLILVFCFIVSFIILKVYNDKN